MKNILQISLIILCIVLSGCSADQRNEKRKKNHEARSRDVIKPSKVSFKSYQDLNQQHLRAFEVRALQKLQDYYDYFNIIADTSLEQEFRVQANEMAELLFNKRSKTNSIEFGKKISIDKELRRLLQSGSTNSYTLLHPGILDSLSQNQNTGTIQASILINQIRYALKVHFSVEEEMKIFGKEKRKALTVKLSEVLYSEVRTKSYSNG